jgi:hypothetical protein
MILCKRNLEDVFFSKTCVGGRRCLECGNMTLLYMYFSIDPTHPGLLDITVIWKRYEYVTMNPFSSSSVSLKIIELLEDNIPILEFMGKFQN